MTSTPSLPADLTRFCEECTQTLANITDDQASIGAVREPFSGLLRNTALFQSILDDVAADGGLLDLRRATMFDNELLLHADPSRVFSLRIYLYGPGEYTPVHDHNSWGVIGPVSGELAVTNYRREDDGSQEGFAQLVESAKMRLIPGETACTLPLNDGIHKVGNPTGRTLVSLNMYGRPVPRSYINGFDVAERRVYRILAPRLKKKLLAADALRGLK
jgi:predicted metal-dependent enzyme (double-stranded beta helix superfamily)